jgi:hypothetical protein
MNSDFFKHTVMLLGMASSAMAAEVSLEGDGKLTGEITSMDAEGNIELVSPVSEKPLLIRGDKTTRIDFMADKKSEQASDQKLELSNGDVLPVKVVSLANGLLTTESEDLGQISIPRGMVSSIQLGIYPKRVIYSGPTDFTGWKRDKEGSRNWKIEGREFVGEGTGSISMDDVLTEKFIIKFSFAWDNYPNFQFRFAEPDGDNSGRVNRYLLQFAGSGFGIFRESPAKSGNVPIVFLNRSSDRLRNNRMEIEIRVDRTRGQLQLYIDGEMEGRYTDPVPGIPKGKCISMISKAPRASRQRIGNIEILEWDDRGDRHRTEDRGDGKTDSLIGRYGERLGGKLAGIRKDGDSTVYLFKSDFQKELLELPEQEVSTVFLGGDGSGAKKDDPGGYIMSLHGGGKMRVSSCVFGSGEVTVVHPLLGSLEIAREGIASLERRAAPEAKPVDKK